jgi:hypothetical protein
MQAPIVATAVVVLVRSPSTAAEVALRAEGVALALAMAGARLSTAGYAAVAVLLVAAGAYA